MRKIKRGQVWVETVIYTLVAFVMIGLVLTFARPKIEELQDKAVLEQTVSLLKEIENTISEIDKKGPGNQRVLEVEINKGFLKISGVNDKIVFETESRYEYSEPGTNITDGIMSVETIDKGDLNVIRFTQDYSSNYDIQYDEGDGIKTVSQSAVAQRILISNKGPDGSERTIINFEVS